MKFAELNEKELMDVEGGVMPHVDKDGTIRTCTGVVFGKAKVSVIIVTPHVPDGPFPHIPQI